MAAANKVFSIAELLESILLLLLHKNILVLQRVSREWNSSVQVSVKLQKLLFFKSIGDIVDLADKGSLPGARNARNHATQCIDTCFRNPMIVEVLKMFGIKTSELYAPSKSFFWTTLRPDNPINRPEASWRRMLFTQPPSKKLNVHGRTVEDHFSIPHSPALTRQSGVPIDNFFGTCEQMLEWCRFVELGNTLQCAGLPLNERKSRLAWGYQEMKEWRLRRVGRARREGR